MYKNRNAIAALLGIYHHELEAFKKLISGFDDAILPVITDTVTQNKNCISRQAILAHVVSSGYTYATYIRSTKNIAGLHPGNILRDNITACLADLDQMYTYTVESFAHLTDDNLAEYDPAKKIQAHWDKQYDIEQIMEHAIVHLMRHRWGLRAM